MQVLLTYAIEILVLAFTSLMLFDLISGIFDMIVIPEPPTITTKSAITDCLKEEPPRNIEEVNVIEQKQEPVKISIPNYSELDPFKLRKLCGEKGLKWRNAHGKNKHLSKAEMVVALQAMT